MFTFREVGFMNFTDIPDDTLDDKDFEEIGRLIQNAPRYFLQKFVSSKILDTSLQNEKTYSDSEFEEIKKILTPYISEIYIR